MKQVALHTVLLFIKYFHIDPQSQSELVRRYQILE